MPNVVNLNKPENRISATIIDKGLYVHKKLGAGLLESVYEEALVFLLQKDGLHVERQKPIPAHIDGHDLGTGFKADLIVENCVLCELKSTEKFHPLHQTQLMTYLRLSNIKIGLLMNFGQMLLKDGLKRMVI